MATITVVLSDSVDYCYWVRSSGGSGTISGSGSSRSWTSTDSSEYITIYPGLANGYNYPIYYNRTDGYSQLVVDSNGNGSDRIISFTQNKYGTLEARYVQPTTYTLTYNGNGHTGGSTASQTGSTSYTVRSCGFTKTGNTFQYWQTASGTRYDPGDWIYLSSNTTLYAHWALNTYSVTYDMAGGTGGPSNGTKYYGTTYTIPSTTPTRTGYEFRYWSDNLESGRQWAPGDSYTTNSNVTFTAIWRIIAYTVTYDMAGGTGGPSNGTKYYGTAYTIPSTIPTRTGYEFRYWSDNLESGRHWAPGDSYTTNSNVTFTAIWRIIAYTVTYDMAGGTGGPSDGIKYYGQAYVIPSTKPIKTGYIFVYWSDNLESGRHWLPGDSYTTNSNVTFTAIWRNKTYFYWHGSDDSDLTYFAVGKRIDLAVTATAWNSLCDFVNTVRGYAGLSSIAFATVSAGQEITSVRYNIVSNAIRQIVNAGYGSVTPVTVSGGDEIVISLFNGSGSLKDAINSAVDAL